MGCVLRVHVLNQILALSSFRVEYRVIFDRVSWVYSSFARCRISEKQFHEPIVDYLKYHCFETLYSSAYLISISWQTVGCNYCFLPLIPVSGTKLLICLTQRHLWRDGLRIAGFAPRNVLAPSQGHPRKGTVGLLYHVKSLRSKLLSDMSASHERSNSTWLAQMISNKGDNHVKKPLQLHQTHMILI